MILKVVAVILLLAIVSIAGAAYRYGFIFNSSPTAAPPEKSVYEFTLKDIDGNEVKLDTYKGKIVMIVNVASKCGYTPQYEGLEAIYKKYKDQGFVILGFPANNFLGQEPGTEKEIKEFCSTKYGVTFPMFSKISVTGKDQHPLFTFLTSKESNPNFGGDISWTFNKFLVDRGANIVARFATSDKPESELVTSAIERYIADN